MSELKGLSVRSDDMVKYGDVGKHGQHVLGRGRTAFEVGMLKGHGGVRVPGEC